MGNEESVIKIEEYLGQFELLGGAGLFIVESPSALSNLSQALEKNELVEARSWWTALQNMIEGKTSFIVIDDYFTEELLSIAAQLKRLYGKISIQDPVTREVTEIRVKPEQPLLLMVASERCLSKLRMRYAIEREVKFIRVI